jgi:uncharacterized protein YjbI with pentapeptide repeats
MPNPEHVKTLKQGAEVWNKWFKRHLADGLPDIAEADLSDANLSGCDLRGVSLKKAILIRANLSGANLSGANLSESFLFRANLEKVEAGGASLNGADVSEANLSGAVLSNGYLIGTILGKANLHSAQLDEADLRSADLKGADLRDANLSRANLSGADLSGADVRQADLSGADLERANLSKASLAGAKFSQVRLYSTIFGSNDLSEAADLENAEHYGPSILNIETIYKSQGKIPENFLRGCGLSDLQIETTKLAAPGLDPAQVARITNRIHKAYLEGGVRHVACFISYNSRDEAFALRLRDDLQENGVRCWLAPEDVNAGDKFRTHIDEAIRAQDKLLVILSENSVNSTRVESEVKTALAEARENARSILFPLRLDDAAMNADQPWAVELRETSNILDFSNKEGYQKAFDGLLRVHLKTAA